MSNSLVDVEKIVALVQLPPPLHGASVMNQAVVESELVNSEADIDVLPIQLARSVDDLNKGGVLKLLSFLKLLVRLVLMCSGRKYTGAYVTICPTGGGFLKDAALVLVLRLFRIPILYHFHGKGVKDYGTKTFYDFLYKRCFANQRVILLSPCLFEDVSDYFDLNNAIYVPNGISAPVNFDRGKGDEIPVVLFLSNMARGKGIFVLLDAAVKLFEQGIKFRVEFAGDWYGQGEEEEFNRKLQSMSDTQRQLIHYHGPVYGEEKDEIYRKCDVFCFPSYIDTFPLVILEAMAHGKAIISTFEGAIPEIIEDGKTGLLCQQNNASDLASKIRFLIEEESERETLAFNAKQSFGEKYTLEVFEYNMKKSFKWFRDSRHDIANR